MDEDTRAVLWLAIEDYAGLWEVAWQLATLHPEFSAEALRPRARTIVQDLAERRLVDGYWCREPYGELTLMLAADLIARIPAEDAWDEPVGNRLSTRIGATPAGESLYNER